MATRREVLNVLTALGVGTLPFRRALAAQAPDNPKGVSSEMVRQAEWIAGIQLTDEQRTLVAAALSRLQAGLSAARAEELPNGLAPAVHFSPTPGEPFPAGEHGTAPQAPHAQATSPNPPVPPVQPLKVTVSKPDNDQDIAFATVAQLGHWLRSKQLSSVELTKLCLARLRQYDPLLKFVVTITEDLALRQAKQADEELAGGQDRGPLHGIPWGAKDLIAVPGYPTTWGSALYKEQTLAETATVARKLEAAGAVLVAKLALGTLAWGDVWHGGQTRNPWNPRQGSSGSSAGSASAVAAGCVPFALGSETLGSIISPSRRCGVTGLRPTFGRVSRHGCMALAWSVDKLGPIARCVEDCALVLDAIRGADPHDPTAQDRPFHWPPRKLAADFRVGYLEKQTRPEVLEDLQRLGVTLVPIHLPAMGPYRVLNTIITVESAAAFDHLTRAGISDGVGLWATSFREGQFIPATDYVRAQRLRSRLMRDMAALMSTVDAYLAANDLLLTNMTGHPSICLPHGTIRTAGGEAPNSIVLTGQLFNESDLLALAHALQSAGSHHRRRPPL